MPPPLFRNDGCPLSFISAAPLHRHGFLTGPPILQWLPALETGTGWILDLVSRAKRPVEEKKGSSFPILYGFFNATTTTTRPCLRIHDEPRQSK